MLTTLMVSSNNHIAQLPYKKYKEMILIFEIDKLVFKRSHKIDTLIMRMAPSLSVCLSGQVVLYTLLHYFLPPRCTSLPLNATSLLLLLPLLLLLLLLSHYPFVTTTTLYSLLLPPSDYFCYYYCYYTSLYSRPTVLLLPQLQQQQRLQIVYFITPPATITTD